MRITAAIPRPAPSANWESRKEGGYLLLGQSPPCSKHAFSSVFLLTAKDHPGDKETKQVLGSELVCLAGVLTQARAPLSLLAIPPFSTFPHRLRWLVFHTRFSATDHGEEHVSLTLTSFRQRPLQPKTLLSDTHPKAASQGDMFALAWPAGGVGPEKSLFLFLCSHHYCSSSVPSHPNLYFISTFFLFSLLGNSLSNRGPFWLLPKKRVEV